MTPKERRSEIAEKLAPEALRQIQARGWTIHDTVVVIADEADPNATLLLRALGIAAEPGRTSKDMNLALVLMTHAQVQQAVATIGPPDGDDIATALGTPRPDRLTMLVVAFGGWSIASIADTRTN